MRSHFHAPVGELEWTVNAYTLSYAVRAARTGPTETGATETGAARTGEAGSGEAAALATVETGVRTPGETVGAR
jgi:hypothetical protein